MLLNRYGESNGDYPLFCGTELTIRVQSTKGIFWRLKIDFRKRLFMKSS